MSLNEELWSQEWSKIDSIEGWLSEVEARQLYELARKPTAEVVVEIGSFLGRSTAALSLGIRTSQRTGSKVYAVDTWQGDGDGSRDRIEKLGVNARIEHWNKQGARKSAKVDRLLKQFPAPAEQPVA